MQTWEAGIAVLTILRSLQVAQGIKCYSCDYAVSNGVEVGESLCKARTTLKDDLIEECTLDAKLSSSRVNRTVTLRDLRAATRVDPNQDTTFVCAELLINGQLLHDEEKGDVSGIIRTCLGLQVDTGSNCKKQTRREWDAGMDSFSRQVSWMMSSMTEESISEACFCTGDKCNSSLSMSSDAPAAEMSFSSITFVWLWIVSKVVQDFEIY